MNLKLDIMQLSFIEEEAQWHLCAGAIIYQNLPSCAQNKKFDETIESLQDKSHRPLSKHSEPEIILPF